MMLGGTEGIFSIIGLAIIASVLALFLKESKLPVFALLTALVAGVVIFLEVLPKVSELLALFEDIAGRASFSTYYLAIVFKIIGIAYIAEFGAQLCRDADQGAIAMKVEFAAKIGIMLIAMPIMVAILESVIRLLS